MRIHERRAGHGLSRSGGEPGAALQSPILQQRPTGAGLHTMTEAVLLVASAIVGLERALHAWPPRAPVGAQADAVHEHAAGHEHGAQHPGRGCADPAVYGRSGRDGNRAGRPDASRRRVTGVVLSPSKAGATVPDPRQTDRPRTACTSPETFTIRTLERPLEPPAGSERRVSPPLWV